MKKFKKPFAVLAFCVCPVIPLARRTDYEHAFGTLKCVMIYKDESITDPLNYIDYIEIITVE